RRSASTARSSGCVTRSYSGAQTQAGRRSASLRDRYIVSIVHIMAEKSRSVVAIDRAFELADRLGTLMADALADRGLTPRQAHVIDVLTRRGPLVQRELGDALGCIPRHVTTLVDALERSGLVARSAHPTDRRALLVRLTGHGQ